MIDGQTEVSGLIFPDKYLPDPSLHHPLVHSLQVKSPTWLRRDGLLCK